jgi:phosphatidate cytidylyltransferase
VLAARLGTAAVLIAGLLAALFLLPPAGLIAVVTAVTGLAGYEWARLCRIPGPGALAYAALVAAGVAGGTLLAWADAGIAAGILFWLLAAPLWLRLGVSAAQSASLALAGVVVLVAAGLAMLAMSPLQIVLVLGLTSVADSAAYFTGRRFGRRKLAPAISPGKTWEGAYGAAAATLLLAVAYQVLVPQLQAAISGTAWIVYLLAATALLALSILGDLFESALKRQAGAKDSGTLLPGHGGILDRIDSATATLPLAAGLWALIGGK